MIETRTANRHPTPDTGARRGFRPARQHVPITVASTACDAHAATVTSRTFPNLDGLPAEPEQQNPATFRASHTNPSILLKRHGPSSTPRSTHRRPAPQPIDKTQHKIMINLRQAVLPRDPA
jgi:hypothetical protein